MFEEINWENVEVGGFYKYEDKYYIQLKVLVLNKKVINDEMHDDYYKFKLLVLRIYEGQNKEFYEVGNIITVGKSLSTGTYLTSGMKFKPEDGHFEYCFFNNK